MKPLVVLFASVVLLLVATRVVTSPPPSCGPVVDGFVWAAAGEGRPSVLLSTTDPANGSRRRVINGVEYFEVQSADRGLASSDGCDPILGEWKALAAILPCPTAPVVYGLLRT